jgi:hypothetical protein
MALAFNNTYEAKYFSASNSGVIKIPPASPKGEPEIQRWPVMKISIDAIAFAVRWLL